MPESNVTHWTTIITISAIYSKSSWKLTVGHCVVLVVLRGGLEHGSDGVQVGADHRRADHGARRRQLLVGNQLRRLLTHLVVLHHLLLLLAALWLEVVLHQVELVIVGKRRNVLLLVLPLPEAVGGTGAGVTVIGELASGWKGRLVCFVPQLRSAKRSCFTCLSLKVLTL